MLSRRIIYPALLILLVFLPACTPPAQESTVPLSEPVVKAFTTDDPNFNGLYAYLDEYLKNHGDDYRDAVKLICFELAKLCTESEEPEKNLNKVIPSYPKADESSGRVFFQNPMNGMGANTYAYGFQLEDGNVVGMELKVIEEIDSCPCTSDYYPGFLDDEFLDVIAKIGTLEHLTLQDAKISDAGLKKLAHLTELKTLALNEYHNYQKPLQCQLDFSGFQVLHGLTKLERLIVRQGENSADQVQSEYLFEAIAHYPNLRELQTQYVTLDHKNVELLATCRQLEILHLDNSQMTYPCFDQLETLDQLEYLKLDFDPKGHVVSFARHLNLKDLRITLTGDPELPVLEEQVLKLSELENVSYININTHGFLQPHFEFTDFPNLKDIYIVIQTTDRMDDLASVILLQNLPVLKSFVCSGMPSKISLSLNETENIKRLLLSSTSPIPAELMDEILKLENLEQLDIQGPFDEMDITQLNRLKNLTHLKLTGKPSLSPEFRLAGLENIRRMDLSNIAGTENLVFENLPNLTSLQTSYTSAEKLVVSDCPQLNEFYGSFGGGHIGNLIFVQCPALTKFRGDLYSSNSIGSLDLRGTNVQKIDWLGNYQESNRAWPGYAGWLPETLMPE